MCGLSGFARAARANREGDAELIRRMNNRLAHRGPDDEGYFVGRGLALGHRRLSIIDLSTGHQPILDESGEHGIVFNGEIYNYRELRAELEAKGHRFRTGSDTEVILRLYLEEGPDCVRRLNGIFAFAVFNVLSGEVFLARDHYGVKPLYYGQNTAGDLYFASELKALRPFLEGKPTLDREALELYLFFEHVPAPLSIFREIRKLEAGHSLRYRDGRAAVASYYEPAFLPKWEGLSLEEAGERLEALLSQAVKRQMVSDVPVGSFLSGGIDSSLVATLLSRHAGKPIDTFSIGFEQRSFDESAYARRVAGMLDSRHHAQVFSTEKMREELPRVLAHMDEPFADPSLLPTALLSRFSRETVKVAMSGDGSDELFAGYPTYLARRVAGFLPRPLGWLGAAAAGFLPTSRENISFDFKVKRFFRGFETGDRDLRHQVWLGAFSLGELSGLLRERDSRGLALLGEHMSRAKGLRGWERSLWCDFRFYLQDNMFTKVDRASMAYGLEVRVPFLDRDLVDFSLRLPSAFKLRGGEPKALLKRIALRYLPDEIVKRPKKGFGIPVADWIRGDLNGLVRERLDDVRLKRAGLFEPRFVQELLRRHEQGAADYRKQLWALFVFESWKEGSYGS